jgi:hypothetical protein
LVHWAEIAKNRPKIGQKSALCRKLFCFCRNFLSIGPYSPIIYQSTGPEHSKYERHVGVRGVSRKSVSRTKNAKLVQIDFLGKFGAQKWSKPQKKINHRTRFAHFLSKYRSCAFQICKACGGGGVSGNSVSRTKNAKLVQIELLGFGAQKWSKPQKNLSIGPDSPIFYQSTGPEHSKYVGKFCVKYEKREN